MIHRPNPNTHTLQSIQTFQTLMEGRHDIGQLIGRSPFVWGPRVQKWNDQDQARASATRRQLIERLQAAHKKWPQWLRGGRGLTEAELDACKQLASMSEDQRQRLLSIRFPPE